MLDLEGFSVPTLYIQKGLQSMKQFNYKSKNNHIQIKIDIESPREYKNNIIKKWKSWKHWALMYALSLTTIKR